ncbi:MAG: hypothetical protein AABY15_01165 [Nanoarchaeota archaeon]
MDGTIIIIGGVLFLWGIFTSQNKGFWAKLIIGIIFTFGGLFMPPILSPLLGLPI